MSEHIYDMGTKLNSHVKNTLFLTFLSELFLLMKLWEKMKQFFLFFQDRLSITSSGGVMRLNTVESTAHVLTSRKIPKSRSPPGHKHTFTLTIDF